MSRKPAKKIISAPVRKFPTAKLAAAAKFTSKPRNVSTLGLMPVAAITPTILSSSHLPPVPMPPVNVAISIYLVSQNRTVFAKLALACAAACVPFPAHPTPLPKAPAIAKSLREDNMDASYPSFRLDAMDLSAYSHNLLRRSVSHGPTKNDEHGSPRISRQCGHRLGRSLAGRKLAGRRVRQRACPCSGDFRRSGQT